MPEPTPRAEETPAAGVGAPAARARSRLGLALRVAVSALLLGVLAARLEPEEGLALLRAARIELLALALAVELANRLVGALRWHLLLRGAGGEVALPRVVRHVFVSGFLGLLAPGTVGVEAVRVYQAARDTGDAALSVSSVLVERGLALLALVALVLLGVSLAPEGLPPAVARGAWLALAAMAAGVLLLMHARLRALTRRLLPGEALAPLRRGLDRVHGVLDLYRGRPRVLVAGLAMALLFQLLRVARIAVTALALGIELPFVYFLVLTPAILFATQLPLSVAGLGVREAGFVYLFGLAGVGAEAAFTLALSDLVFFAFGVLPGALLYLRGGRDAPPARR